jgi:MoaA/NifB/PqqE/SkfB family radical SAM enzyme
MTSGLGSIALTGGEPTLRKDLGEICRIFNERSHTRYVGIASNGLLPDRICDTCEWILEHCELDRLNVQVSLDGPREIHDEIRGVPDAFDKAMETIDLLCELRKEHANFSVNTALAIQPQNYSKIEALIQYLLPLDIEMKFLIVRGSNYGTYKLNPQVSSEFDPISEESASISLDVEQLESLYLTLKKLNKNAKTEFWSELEQAKMYTALRILEEKRRVNPCYAGVLEGVIYSNGDVAVCEPTKPFGNLRESGYDFYELWNSDAAHWMRSQIRTCACIHDCNLTTGLRFEPEILYSTVTGRSLRNREQRWRREASARQTDGESQKRRALSGIQ